MISYGVVAKKIGMTRMVDSEGAFIPVTLLKVEHQKVTKHLSPERDGYCAIQIGYQAKKAKKLARADVFRLKKVGIDDKFSLFFESRMKIVPNDRPLGYEITGEELEGLGHIDVTGISKGKGFQGAVRRWGHKTGKQTHGSHFHRRPGSLGQRTTPGRVFKNKKMPGHQGAVRKTVQNLKVVDLNKEEKILAVKGSVPGCRNSYVLVRAQIKSKKVF